MHPNTLPLIYSGVGQKENAMRKVGVIAAIVFLGACGSGHAAATFAGGSRAVVPPTSATATVQTMAEWRTQVGPMLRTIYSDLADVQGTMRLEPPNVSLMTTWCAEFQADIGRMKAQPPVPDPAAAVHLSAAMDGYEAAMTHCILAAPRAQLVGEVAAATSELALANIVP